MTWQSTNGHSNGQTDRILPQSIEAEQGALGSILLDASVLPQIVPLLNPFDFFRDSHQVIYQAILDLGGRGAPVDSVTVIEELQRRGTFEAIGGDATVAEILAAVPHTANAAYYAQIVRQKAVQRRVIDGANQILSDGYSGQFTAEELLERAGVLLARPGPVVRHGPPVARPAATLADVRRVVGEVQWLWRLWLIDAHLTVLASEPGVGKTRLVLDLCRRLWLNLEWPDGELPTRPRHTPSLWVAADRHHSQLLSAAAAMGMPDEAVYFNAPPEAPTGGLRLDEPHAIDELAGRIIGSRAGLAVIDTVNKTTRRPLYRPEEAEAFFGPLLDLAMDLRVPILALTHLSKGGDPLDRRIEGTCRVSWRLEWPDRQGQPDRRKLWVPKSIDQLPPPLGVTMGHEGNEYDSNPPAPAVAHGGPRPGAGRPSSAIQEAMDWLREYLGSGPARCSAAIDAALEAGHTKRTTFRAVEALGVLTEGPEGGKYFRLPDGPAQPEVCDDPY